MNSGNVGLPELTPFGRACRRCVPLSTFGASPKEPAYAAAIEYATRRVACLHCPGTLKSICRVMSVTMKTVP
ncbi:MAG: hypothetical protein DWI29_05090 [Planctomycetota bacterium]|nr:MAG: hypothetical protein DWI29_05090 [Planctomycetota bacterium]